jgi:plastocyanin
MKRQTLLLLVASLLVNIPVVPQEAFRNLIFSAILDTAQITHDLNVPSMGRGVAGLTFVDNKLFVNLTVNGLTGPVTNAHIHVGEEGVAGTVVYPLTDFIDGNKISGVIENINLADGALEKFLNEGYYINVHTQSNSQGEIRGQIRLETDHAFVASIDREQAGVITVPQNHAVEVRNNFFDPSELTINLGDTVTFIWKEGFHTTTSIATSGADAWDAPMDNSNMEYKLVLHSAGEHSYKCSFHAGMNGVINVMAEPSGLATFNLSQDHNLLEVNVLFSGLYNSVSNAHLHWGSMGVSGSPAIGIMDLREGNTFHGVLDLTTLENQDVFLDSLFKEAIYLNIHTSGYPGGEIRGQLRQGKRLTFDTWLTPGAEVAGTNGSTPASAMGLAAVGINDRTDSIWVSILLDSLSGAATAAHFHLAAAGENGSPVVNLGNMIQGHLIEGWISRDGGEFMGDLGFDEFFGALLEGRIYLNVHTMLNTGGEVRGQVYGMFHSGVVFDICSGQVTGDLQGETRAKGTGLITEGRVHESLHYLAAVTGLSSSLQGSHFHQAAAGQDGDVVHHLDADSVVSGYWMDDSLTPEILEALESAGLYIMFHTSLNSGGEARGQIAYGVQCEVDTTATAVVSLTNKLSVYPNPVSDIMQMDFNEEIPEDMTLQIRNVLGQSVYRRPVAKGVYEISVDVSFLAKGIYLLEIAENSNTRFVSRFIKK